MKLELRQHLPCFQVLGIDLTRATQQILALCHASALGQHMRQHHGRAHAVVSAVEDDRALLLTQGQPVQLP